MDGYIFYFLREFIRKGPFVLGTIPNQRMSSPYEYYVKNVKFINITHMVN